MVSSRETTVQKQEHQAWNNEHGCNQSIALIAFAAFAALALQSVKLYLAGKKLSTKRHISCETMSMGATSRWQLVRLHLQLLLV